MFSEIKGVVGRPTEEVGCWKAFMELHVLLFFRRKIFID